MKKGDRAHGTALGITLEGEALLRLGGYSVLCAGLLPGERGELEIEAVSRQHPRAHARLLRLEQPHPARRPAPCPNHPGQGGACDGCALMELAEDAQREAKRALLAQEFGLSVASVEAGADALGYRWSSKRVALGERGRLVLGSFRRGSHAPAAMRGCLVDHPRLAKAFDEVERAANELGIEPYDERLGRGDLRYVWAKTNGTQVMVTLITASEDSRARERLPTQLARLDGVAWSVQGARANALRGAAPQPVCGLTELRTHLLGQEVEVGALGFLQPNPQVAELAYEALTSLDDVPAPHGLAWDLYAGAGVTTRKLARDFLKVVPCEAYPESAAALGIPAQTVEAFLLAQEKTARSPDLVVANPPRKGMGLQVCQALLDLAPPVLRIMSCGPAGLARDLASLAAGYELTSLRAFDTLPQTPHLELVACLRRKPT